MNNILIILISIIALPYSISGQNCFTILGDFNGFLNEESISELQNKSCELIDTLPSRFSSDFRVFDFGFYPLKEFTSEKFISDWENAKNISSDSSQYYLLIGREASINGIYHKIHIDLKFPTTFEFSCVTDEQIAYIRFQIEKEVNKIKGNLLVEIESVALDLLIKFIDDKIICCNSSNRNICGNCLETEEFVTYVEDNNFKTIEVSTLTSANYTNLTQHVKQYAQLNFVLDGQSINLNEEIISLSDEISEFADSVLIEIYSFNEDCESTFNAVENKHFSDNSATYFHIKIVGIHSPLGDKISIKVESNIYQGKGEGNLYVFNLNSGYETAQIISSTQYFFDLAGIKAKLTPITKLKQIGDYDGLVVIGNNKKKVSRFILGNVMTMLDTHEPCSTGQHDNESQYNEWYLKPFKDWPEVSSRKTILISNEDFEHMKATWNDSQNNNKLLGTNANYRLLSYIILHGTSHNAGFLHDDITNEKTGLGFFAEGRGYAGSGSNHTCWLNDFTCSTTYETINSFEDIINWTKESFKYIIIQTNARYGYL